MASDISIIITVYNRPDEIEELLKSLVDQSDHDFDVIVVDDGSEKKSDLVVEKFRNKLTIQYFFKTNTGPGDSRNYGCNKSKADFFIFFDSDCIIPEDYFKLLRAHVDKLDAYGGPDKAHPGFTPVQKAIS